MRERLYKINNVLVTWADHTTGLRHPSVQNLHVAWSDHASRRMPHFHSWRILFLDVVGGEICANGLPLSRRSMILLGVPTPMFILIFLQVSMASCSLMCFANSFVTLLFLSSNFLRDLREMRGQTTTISMAQRTYLTISAALNPAIAMTSVCG